MKARKRFKHTQTLLEDLPNEILIEVFIYLSDIDNVYAFSQLNSRFQDLILNQCSRFDFKSVNKTKFDYIIKQHNMNKWRSLRLSDDDHTPGQVSHFCKLYSFSNDLSQLETLSIINLKQPTASLFVCHLKLFTNLVSLTIGSVCGKTMPLVQLPNLKHLVISSCMHTNWMKV